MKKIDFHIHTISTPSDSSFSFSLSQLKEYIHSTEIDAIAITNHNMFDVNQFKTILESINISVFPGIEINLENGHLLLISDGTELSDFTSRCEEVTQRIVSPEDSISTKELNEIFIDLTQYILIPHYDKKPEISKAAIDELSEYITAGEVNSPKKFVYCMKNNDSLVPVYFSDSRIKSDFKKFPARQTFISCGDVTFGTIKSCFRDKSKVSLSPQDGYLLFSIFEDGQELSTGLNVIVGERSSGKSYTLDRISNEFENVKYIQQFSLLERDKERDEEKFNKLLSDRHSLLTQEYLKEFQEVVNDVAYIDLEESSKSISNYLQSLVKYAKESEKRDSFSKASLFSEEEFEISNLNGLKDLIRSVQHLIENIEYKTIIDKHLLAQDLQKLIVELMKEYGKKEEDRLKKRWLNDLMAEIKKKLQMRTAATTIEDADLYQVALDLKKVQKFKEISKMVRRDHEIMKKDVQGYKVVAKTSEFLGAGELKKLSKSKSSYRDAFLSYSDPYKFLQKLKQIDSLPEADFFKYFAKIEYQILNKDGFEVSGGERSEFNLLQEIYDAQRYDLLLIDEPESSFDNLFLKNEVNEMIKDISKTMPVVLVTHNSTVGASIKPEYLLCTKKEVVDGKIKYRIYSGFPTDKELVSRDGQKLSNLEVTMNCLEAGKPAYDDRRKSYEDLGN